MMMKEDNNGGTVISEALETWPHSGVEEFIWVQESRWKRNFTNKAKNIM